MSFNIGSQPLTRWHPFLAATMLRSPEPTKEKVELTIFSITAIEIRHLISFTLLLLLRIQRYMCRHHDSTWAYANNSYPLYTALVIGFTRERCVALGLPL